MASGDVKITVAADMASFVQAWAHGLKGPQQFSESIKHINDALRTSDHRAGAFMGNLNRQLFGTSAALLGIGSTLGGIVTTAQILRREYESLRDAQDRSGQMIKTLAELEAEFTAASSGKALLGQPVSMDAVIDYVHKRAPEMKMEQIIAGATAGMSAVWEAKPEDVLNIVAAYGRYKPFAAKEEFANTVKGATAMMQEKWYTAEEAAAQMVNLQAVSVSDEMNAVAERLVPSTIALWRQFGQKDEPADIMAVLSMIGAKAIDPKGRRTTTNVGLIFEKLQRLGILSGVFKPDIGFEEMRKQILERQDPDMQKFRKSLLGVAGLKQEAAEQQGISKTSPSEMRRLLADIRDLNIALGGEQRIRPFIEMMLVGNQDYLKSLAAMRKDIPEQAGVMEAYERNVMGRLRASRYQTTYRQALRTETAQQFAELSDRPGGMVGADMESFNKMLASAGVWWGARKGMEFERFLASKVPFFGERAVQLTKAGQLDWARLSMAQRGDLFDEDKRRLFRDLGDAARDLRLAALGWSSRSDRLRIEGSDGSRRTGKPGAAALHSPSVLNRDAIRRVTRPPAGRFFFPSPLNVP